MGWPVVTQPEPGSVVTGAGTQAVMSLAPTSRSQTLAFPRKMVATKPSPPASLRWIGPEILTWPAYGAFQRTTGSTDGKVNGARVASASAGVLGRGLPVMTSLQEVRPNFGCL